MTNGFASDLGINNSRRLIRTGTTNSEVISEYMTRILAVNEDAILSRIGRAGYDAYQM